MNATTVLDPRIAAIYRSGLFDRAGSEQFGHLTEHVRVMLGVPVAIISIVGEGRQIFAGHCGLPEPWATMGETPISHSFCQHVVASNAPLIVEDARSHALLRTNQAIGDIGVVAYLGVPIRLPGGHIGGALAAIDTAPRRWTDQDRRSLESLAIVVEKEIEVGASEILYRTLFEETQEGYYAASAIRDRDGVLVDILFEDVNPAFQRLTGLPPERVVGARLSDIAPDTVNDMLSVYGEVLDLGKPLVHASRATSLEGKWYENRIRRIGHDRLASVFVDVTERKVAEGRLRDSERELRTVIDTLPVGILLAEAPSGRIVMQNGRLEQMLGHDAAQAKSVAEYGMFVATHPDGSPFDPNQHPLARIMAGDCESAQVDVLYQKPDGSTSWISIIGEAIQDSSGVLSGAIVIVTDISDRKRADAEKELLNTEMAHRLKNMLAMVQAIATQTLRSVTEQHHVQSFEKRLHALSGAHDVLLRDSHDAAPVDAIISTTLQRIAPSDRVELDGPRTVVGPKGTLSLALLLHELGTNAVKYGALSNEVGRVAIRWSLEGEGSDRTFRLLWQESGGPAVRRPDRRGFGSKLVRMGLIGAGGVEMDYEPSGLRVMMTAPLSQLQHTE